MTFFEPALRSLRATARSNYNYYCVVLICCVTILYKNSYPHSKCVHANPNLFSNVTETNQSKGAAAQLIADVHGAIEGARTVRSRCSNEMSRQRHQ